MKPVEKKSFLDWCKFCKRWTLEGSNLGYCSLKKARTIGTESCASYAEKESYAEVGLKYPQTTSILDHNGDT